MKCAAGHCRLVEGILAVQGRGGCQEAQFVVDRVVIKLIGLGIDDDIGQSWTWLTVAERQQAQAMITDAKLLLQEQLSPQQLQQARYHSENIIAQLPN